MAALEAGLRPILCVGETLEEREADKLESVLQTQIRGALAELSSDLLKQVTVAYEPVWAIGTGVVATPAQAQDAHQMVRKMVADLNPAVAREMRILYGGSVKGSNAAELLGQPDIDGALVGGASLKAEDFGAIIAIAEGLVK